MALGVGIAAGGGGGYAVFASTNQAGTAILLILSAIFLLIGIQGTSLIRFSTGSNTVELERRGRKVVQAAEEIAEEEPERAAGMIEGAQLAIPGLSTLTSHAQASLIAALYEQSVKNAIAKLGFTTSNARAYSDIDMVVTDDLGRTVDVAVKYSKGRNFSRSWVYSVLRQRESNIPLLIVTNSPMRPDTVSSLEEFRQAAPVRLVSWEDGSDIQTLRDALAELFNSVSPIEQGLVRD